MGDVESHKRVVRRLFDDLWNGRDLSVIPELYSEQFVADYRPYGPLRKGHDGVRAMVEAAITTFPDFHEELLGRCAEDDTVAVHLRITDRWPPGSQSRRRRDVTAAVGQGTST